MIFDDRVVLVNGDDEATGETNKLVAHKYPLQRHRAVSVWLLRHPNKHGFDFGFGAKNQQNNQSEVKKTEVLLQQRSRQKIVGALWWGNAICGNVFPGETYAECAERRLRAELGILKVPLKEVYKFEYQAYANDQYGEHEMDQVFVGDYQGDVVRNPDEVKDFLWVELDELRTAVAAWHQANPHYPTAAESLKIKEDELRRTSLAVSLELAGQKIIMVPWTMIMLLDERLWKVLK